MSFSQSAKDIVRSPLSRALLTATVLVCLIYSNVVFLGATFQPSAAAHHLASGAQHSVSLFPPHHEFEKNSSAYADLGATSWQSEPMRNFVSRSLTNHESIFWNPYSAAGSVGPETLVDLKTSPLTLFQALFFNASAVSFDFGLIFILIFSSAALFYLGYRHLSLGQLASTMMVVAFLLTGYATANINSQNGQSYFFAPFVLLSLFNFYKKPGFDTWLVTLLTQALLLMITMIPVTLSVLFACHIIALLYGWDIQSRLGVTLKSVAVQFFTPVPALALTAWLWLPIIEFMFSADLVDSYKSRKLIYFPSEHFLSILSSRHFWETYNGIMPIAQLQEAGVLIPRSSISHLGIAGFLLVASYGFSKKFRLMTAGCFLLLFLVYGKIFGIPPFKWLDAIPFINTIGRQYLGSISCLSFCILTGIAFSRIKDEKPWLPGLLFATVFFVTSIYSVYAIVDWPDFRPFRLNVTLGVLIFLSSLLLVSLATFIKKPNYRKTASVILASLVFVELFYYINHQKPPRHDLENNPPAFVQFLQNNLDGRRVFSIGNIKTLMPEYGSFYGIRQISTMNSSTLPWYREFYEHSFGKDWNLFLALSYGPISEDQNALFPPNGKHLINDQSLDLLGVKYIVINTKAKKYIQYFSDKNYPLRWKNRTTVIFENTNLLPDVMFYRKIELTNRYPVSYRRMLIDAVHTADKKLYEKNNLLASLDNEKDIAKLLTFKNTLLEYQVETKSPAVMAINEVWHPDWKATINGEPTDVYRVNGAFRGVFVPAGKHLIRFEYHKTSFWIGVYTSILLIGLLVFFRFFIYSKKNRTGLEEKARSRVSVEDPGVFVPETSSG